VTSLMGAWMVGPRLGRYDIDGKVVPFRGHSMVRRSCSSVCHTVVYVIQYQEPYSSEYHTVTI